jgi:hypothetical protein
MLPLAPGCVGLIQKAICRLLQPASPMLQPSIPSYAPSTRFFQDLLGSSAIGIGSDLFSIRTPASCR